MIALTTESASQIDTALNSLGRLLRQNHLTKNPYLFDLTQNRTAALDQLYTAVWEIGQPGFPSADPDALSHFTKNVLWFHDHLVHILRSTGLEHDTRLGAAMAATVLNYAHHRSFDFWHTVPKETDDHLLNQLLLAFSIYQRTHKDTFYLTHLTERLNTCLDTGPEAFPESCSTLCSLIFHTPSCHPAESIQSQCAIRRTLQQHSSYIVRLTALQALKLLPDAPEENEKTIRLCHQISQEDPSACLRSQAESRLSNLTGSTPT